MAWFHMHQNNSGGYLHGPARNLFVEVPDGADRATIRAAFEAAGVDFNTDDCPCCGTRWDFYDDEPCLQADDCTPAASARDLVVWTWNRGAAPLLATLQPPEDPDLPDYLIRYASGLTLAGDVPPEYR